MDSSNLKYNIQSNILASIMPKKLAKSAYGYDLSSGIFVGLPASNMKGKWIQITIHSSDHSNAIVPIGHVGPWNGGGWDHKFDDPYWRKKHRPQAETGKNFQHKKTDKSGIQLSYTLSKLLGIEKKKTVFTDWHFVSSPKNKKALINTTVTRKTYVP